MAINFDKFLKTRISLLTKYAKNMHDYRFNEKGIFFFFTFINGSWFKEEEIAVLDMHFL